MGVRKSKLLRLIVVASLLLSHSGVYANSALSLRGSSSFKGDSLLKGIRLNPDNPYEIEFLLSSSENTSDTTKQELVDNFFSSVAVPQDDIWVNLSPNEPNRILDKSLKKSKIGKLLMSQDLVLKKVSSLATHPGTELGKQFWESSSSSLQNLDKIWIVPGEIALEKTASSIVIKEALLEVETSSDNKFNQSYLDKIKDEVNSSPLFAELRQLYHSHILAMWFKSVCLNSIYKKTINSGLPFAKLNNAAYEKKIYSDYLNSVEAGEYSVELKVRDYADESLKKVKYFSGGIGIALDKANLNIVEVNGHSENFNLKVEVLGSSSIELNANASQEQINEYLKKVAGEKGIVLTDESKIGLFIGGEHIYDGYYYQLFYDVMQKNKLDLVYLPIPVTNAEMIPSLENFMQDQEGIVGTVITRPWKEAFAKPDNPLGAVNFIVKREQKLDYTVTDAIAWLNGLNRDLGYEYDFNGKSVLVYGAGGAARELAELFSGKNLREIVFVDLDQGKLDSVGRLLDSMGFAGDYRLINPKAQEDTATLEQALADSIANSDLLINATGIGRQKTKGISPMAKFKSHINSKQVYCDLISNEFTQFLIDAKDQGATTVTGQSMFVYGMVEFMYNWVEASFDKQLDKDALYNDIDEWLIANSSSALGSDLGGVSMDLRLLFNSEEDMFRTTNEADALRKNFSYQIFDA